MTFFKPSPLATFVVGKLLGVARGSVATLNWVVSCWNNIKHDSDSFVRLRGVTSGTPEIYVDGTALDNYLAKYMKNHPNSALANAVTNAVSDYINEIEVVGDEYTNVSATVTKTDKKVTIKLGVYYK